LISAAISAAHRLQNQSGLGTKVPGSSGGQNKRKIRCAEEQNPPLPRMG